MKKLNVQVHAFVKFGISVFVSSLALGEPAAFAHLASTPVPTPSTSPVPAQPTPAATPVATPVATPAATPAATPKPTTPTPVATPVATPVTQIPPVIPAPKPVHNLITIGNAVTTTAGKDSGLSITGRAMLVRYSNGTTEAFTHFSGLKPSTPYGVHVHALPCALGAGGHYKNNPAETGTVAANEIWPQFTTDAQGVGHGYAKANFLARPEAQSVVVHSADGAKIACADLASNPKQIEVTWGKFSAAAKPELKVTGAAAMLRSSTGTSFTALVNGLDPKLAYSAHVHDLPCNVNSGGGHYKIDPSVTTAVATNELWPAINAFGNQLLLTLNTHHVARPEAQSVVIHDAMGTRVACVSLAPLGHSNLVTSGKFTQLLASADKKINLAGAVRMVRTFQGDTVVRLKVSGLAPNTSYEAHVHDRSCASGGGGGHYKINPAVSTAEKANEIWPLFSTNKKGVGSANVKTQKHLARPEAQSVVIHAADGSRLGCADLELQK